MVCTALAPHALQSIYDAMNSTPRTLVQIDTVLTADSVEWCPVDSVDQLLALGTYQLDETTRTRLGSLTLFSYNPQTTTLHPVAQEKTNILKQGVLDIKWFVSTCCHIFLELRLVYYS